MTYIQSKGILQSYYSVVRTSLVPSLPDLKHGSGLGTRLVRTSLIDLSTLLFSFFFQSQKDTVANVRTRSQQKAQQLRQKARQTLFNKRRNQTQQQQQQSQTQQLEMDKQQRTPTNSGSSTGVKERLGMASARGRGRGMGVRGRGRGRGGSQAQSIGVGTSRPGSQLKTLRYSCCCNYYRRRNYSTCITRLTMINIKILTTAEIPRI